MCIKVKYILIDVYRLGLDQYLFLKADTDTHVFAQDLLGLQQIVSIHCSGSFVTAL